MIMMNIPVPKNCEDCPCSYMVRTGDYEGMMICNAREFRDTQSGFREELSKYFVVVDAPERPKDCPIRIVKEDKHD